LAVEGSILELLEQHGSLGYEQIAAHLREPPDHVRNALQDLQESGFVTVLAIGLVKGHATSPATYWQLTDAGRQELARRRMT
jgi:predicted ArsR family transcriptional regulator